MDGVKGCLSNRRLTIPEAKECVKDKRCILLGGDVHDPRGEAGCMKQLNLWMFFICFALGFGSSEK